MLISNQAITNFKKLTFKLTKTTDSTPLDQHTSTEVPNPNFIRFKFKPNHN